MTDFTIHDLDEDLKVRLQKRANYYGRTLEEEAKVILKNALVGHEEHTENLAARIERRFAEFGEFELPAIQREFLREPPDFKEFYDCP